MSFTKAASNLYISQQGVSKSIKTLEDELGVSLFLRTNSSISLTNYGVILQRYAEDLVNNYTKVLTEINTEKNRDRNGITLGFPNGIANYFPAEIFETYLKSHPNVRISIREYADTEVDEALVRGDIDIGFCVVPVDKEKLNMALPDFCAGPTARCWILPGNSGMITAASSPKHSGMSSVSHPTPTAAASTATAARRRHPWSDGGKHSFILEPCSDELERMPGVMCCILTSDRTKRVTFHM